jgi:hypothetical protein
MEKPIERSAFFGFNDLLVYDVLILLINFEKKGYTFALLCQFLLSQYFAGDETGFSFFIHY